MNNVLNFTINFIISTHYIELDVCEGCHTIHVPLHTIMDFAHAVLPSFAHCPFQATLNSLWEKQVLSVPPQCYTGCRPAKIGSVRWQFLGQMQNWENVIFLFLSLYFSLFFCSTSVTFSLYY